MKKKNVENNIFDIFKLSHGPKTLLFDHLMLNPNKVRLNYNSDAIFEDVNNIKIILQYKNNFLFQIFKVYLFTTHLMCWGQLF